VERLIAEETLEGDTFRSLVEADERRRIASGSAGEPSAEPDVKAAQVGV